MLQSPGTQSFSLGSGRIGIINPVTQLKLFIILRENATLVLSYLISQLTLNSAVTWYSSFRLVLKFFAWIWTQNALTVGFPSGIFWGITACPNYPNSMANFDSEHLPILVQPQ